MLKDKVAVIYGGAGSLGSGIAQAYVEAGARVFLAGRTRETLRTAAAGTGAEYDVLDAMDEAAVEAHATSVVERAGRIDISLNLVPRGDLHGVPLTEMSVEDYTRPVVRGITCQFIGPAGSAGSCRRVPAPSPSPSPSPQPSTARARSSRPAGTSRNRCVPAAHSPRRRCPAASIRTRT
ncbi:SDR family NAD(P)-dependent oxidoreductase [Streptomyces sp. NPDC052179]|uniref:SDR family oxidoreductase n=1 Tax=Streptomyces sp. NPDC052179 TaxID=3155680 RepID=UPI00344759FD